MTIAQSNLPEPEHQVERTTECLPFTRSDEIQDLRVEQDVFGPDKKNSTYLGLNWDNKTDRERFLYEATDETIERYKRLELYNRGTHTFKWTTDQSAKHDDDDFRFCHALTSQMGLPPWQMKAVWRLFKPLNMRTFARFNTPKDEPEYKQYLVAFCIGAILYNHYLPEGCEKWRYYPKTESYPCKSKRYRCPYARLRAQGMGDDGDGHRVIERVADQMGFSETDLESCYQMVLSRLRKYLEDIEDAEDDED